MLNLIIALFLGLACAPQCSVDRHPDRAHSVVKQSFTTDAPAPGAPTVLEDAPPVAGPILDLIIDRDDSADPDNEPEQRKRPIRDGVEKVRNREWFDGSFVRALAQPIWALAAVLALLFLFMVANKRGWV